MYLQEQYGMSKKSQHTFQYVFVLISSSFLELSWLFDDDSFSMTLLSIFPISMIENAHFDGNFCCLKGFVRLHYKTLFNLILFFYRKILFYFFSSNTSFLLFFNFFILIIDLF
jgi:hypothetical protein